MNSEEFFERKYVDSHDRLYRFIYQLCHDEQAAEDLCQETYLALWSEKDKISKHPNPDGWLFITARNKAANYLRLHFHGDRYDIDDDENLKEYSDGGDFAEAILETMMGFSGLSSVLTEDEMKLLTLRFTEGYEVKEIAPMVQVTEAACKMRFSRIFGKLREHPEFFEFMVIIMLLGRWI